MKAPFDVSALRIVWAEPNFDCKQGPFPGAWQFIVEGRLTEDAPWQCLVDASQNQTDLLIDYRRFETVRIRYARIRILGGPAEMAAGLTDFTLFGTGTPIPEDAPYWKYPEENA
jgi:hypothetical protein